MKRFMLLFQTEFLLFIRDFFGFFFTLIFPLLMLILFGSIYGDNPIFSHASSMGMVSLSVPGYSVMIIGVTGLMTFPLTLSEYKDKRIYKRFDATPAGKKNVITAQLCVNILMTFTGCLILLAAGKLLYQIQIKGHILAIFMALLLSIAAMFSMGFFFTAVGRDGKITSLLCYLSYFIMIFLSGATMPDQFFPEKVKQVSALLPMTYAVDLMQGMFGADSPLEYAKEIAVLGGVTVLGLLAGGFLYRNRDWT